MIEVYESKREGKILEKKLGKESEEMKNIQRKERENLEKTNEKTELK